MTIQAQLADGTILEFPDGTDPAVIQRTVKNTIAQSQQLRPEQSATPAEEDFIPTEENLAAEAARVDAIPEKTLADQILGAGEAALTTLTGATGGALGFGAGSLEGAFGELTGRLEEGEGQKRATELASALTFSPRTEAGQDIIQDIGEKLSVLPPILGATPVQSIRAAIPGRSITDKILASPRNRKALLVEQIKSGNPNIDLVTKALDSNDNIITRPSSVKALSVLGGDDAAKRTVSLIENANPATKMAIRKQIDVIEKGNKNALFRNENRPSDVLGKSMLDRGRAIKRINEKSGKEIGAIAKSLDDTSVDIRQPSNDFFNELSGLGVTFKRGDDGWVTPDFSRSKFVGGSQKDMTVLVNDLLNGSPDFNTAHKLKQVIRDNVNFDKGGVGQLNRQSENILKNLSREIDSVLDNTSPKYKKANETFAKTVKLKDDFDFLAGKDIDLSNDLAAQSLGAKGMRLVSNAESRVRIQQILNQTDKALKEMNVRFKDDLPSLVHTTAELNNIFNLAPSGSLKGNIVSGGVEVAESVTSPIAAARAASRVIDKAKTPDFNKKIRALKALTNTEQGK